MKHNMFINYNSTVYNELIKLWNIILFIIVLLILQPNTVFALDVPYLSGRIIDEVGVIDPNVFHSIEEKLKAHEKETSNQIVVLIIPSLEGEVLEEYSLKVATTWKLGQKNKDNGVLLLIVINDRKIRIEVGYGLESILTDAICNRIIRKEIVPYFKENNFSKGVENGVNAILDVLSGTYQSKKENHHSSLHDNEYMEFADELGTDVPLFFRMFVGLIFFIVITPFTIATAVIPYLGWFLYFFLMPFYAIFPVVIFGKWGVLFLPVYVIAMFVMKIFLAFTKQGKEVSKKLESFTKYGSSENSTNSHSGFYSRGSHSSGGFSGGGGSFGGGGSSGSW